MVLASTTLFIASRNVHLTQDDAIRLQDTGRFAIETIGRAVAQAGFVDLEATLATDGGAASTIDPIAGLDNRSLKSTVPALQSPVAQTVNGSDVLAFHFAGSGDSDQGDGSVTNCAGFSVALADPADPADPADLSGGRADRGWSIFYIAKDHTGVPELYCKYRGKKAWATTAIARGVESFQVLYGVGKTRDSAPTQFLTASQVDDLDRNLLLDGATDEARQQGTRRQSAWKKISQIKVALIVRGTLPVRGDLPTQHWNVFGDAYTGVAGDSDLGVQIDEANLPAATRHRMRKLFRADFHLRNTAAFLLSSRESESADAVMTAVRSAVSSAAALLATSAVTSAVTVAVTSTVPSAVTSAAVSTS